MTLSLDIVDHIFDSEDVQPAELMRQLQGVIRRSAVSWTTCRLTLRQIQQDPNWDFLCGAGLTTPDEVSECIGDYDEIFAADCPWRRTTQVPRVFGHHRYFLHCFSGRRRHGDLEHYMRCVQPPEGITLHVISLDIVIDGELGDLLRKESRSYWLHAIAQKWVIGLLCGPPCETWSRARGKLIKGKKGPRVVRSREAPWGKSSLGIREAKQVLFGNTLLLFCLEAFVGLLLNGGCSLIEHPSCPDDSTLVSIWRLPIIYFLLGLPEVQLLEGDARIPWSCQRQANGLVGLATAGARCASGQQQNSQNFADCPVDWTQQRRLFQNLITEGVPTGTVQSPRGLPGKHHQWF